MKLLEVLFSTVMIECRGDKFRYGGAWVRDWVSRPIGSTEMCVAA